MFNSGDLVRGTRGKGVDLKPFVPANDPEDPTDKTTEPFANPRSWAAFILIGDPT